jgi:hypothetical protein
MMYRLKLWMCGGWRPPVLWIVFRKARKYDWEVAPWLVVYNCNTRQGRYECGYIRSNPKAIIIIKCLSFFSFMNCLCNVFFFQFTLMSHEIRHQIEMLLRTMSCAIYTFPMLSFLLSISIDSYFLLGVHKVRINVYKYCKFTLIRGHFDLRLRQFAILRKTGSSE